MEAMILAFKLVFPLCVYMGLGYFLSKKSFFQEVSTKDVNKLVFKVLLPLSVIKCIWGADLRNGIDWTVILFAVGMTLAWFFLCWFLMPHFSKENRVISVMIQGAAKSNYVLIGTSMVAMLYGDQLGMTGVLVAFIAPLNNALSAITFELYRGKKVKIKELLIKIITNPLVASGIIGTLVSLSPIPVPEYIMTQVVGKLAAMATPLAMLMLGATFDFTYVKKYRKEIGIVTVARLIGAPLLEIPIMILCGFRGVNLLAILIISVTPCAVNCYNTALAMDGDADLAGVLVAITSVLSIFTMFMWIALVSGMGLL